MCEVIRRNTRVPFVSFISGEILNTLPSGVLPAVDPTATKIAATVIDHYWFGWSLLFLHSIRNFGTSRRVRQGAAISAIARCDAEEPSDYGSSLLVVSACSDDSCCCLSVLGVRIHNGLFYSPFPTRLVPKPSGRPDAQSSPIVRSRLRMRCRFQSCTTRSGATATRTLPSGLKRRCATA